MHFKRKPASAAKARQDRRARTGRTASRSDSTIARVSSVTTTEDVPLADSWTARTVLLGEAFDNAAQGVLHNLGLALLDARRCGRAG